MIKVVEDLWPGDRVDVGTYNGETVYRTILRIREIDSYPVLEFTDGSWWQLQWDSEVTCTG